MCFEKLVIVQEGIDFALKQGLYADALILARRVWADNPRKIADVERRVLEARDPSHPVITLLTVATDQPVPIIVSFRSLPSHFL